MPKGSTTAQRGQIGEEGLVSVILVNYNGLKFIGPLFQSLLHQTYSPLEILFFDNGSTDGSVEYVKKNFSCVRVIELPQNMGFCRPNNDGIKKSRGQYIFTLNLDVVLNEDFIEKLVKAIETDPHVGWAAGKMSKLTTKGRTDEIDCLGHHFHRDRYAKETDHSRPFSWNDYAHDRYVFGASGCAALYRRVMLNDVAADGQYFDEDFVAYWEDVDLDWRAQLRGWKCLYSPEAIGYHVRGGSGLYRKPEIAACYLANHFLMIIKNDELAHFLEDLVPLVARGIRDFLLYLRNCPLAVPLALKMLLKKVPHALLKRQTIKRGRRVPSSYIRSLIR
jgi:GT2 family glycosyltransferase